MLVTDSLLARRPLPDAVASAVRGGVTAVQVRASGLDARSIYDLTLSLSRPVKEAGALLIVNHFPDVAVAAAIGSSPVFSIFPSIVR